MKFPGSPVNPQIIGGSNAIPGQFPWQVSIIMDNTNFCGGSLISDLWILTAAHCVIHRKSFLIRTGSIFNNKEGQSIQTTTKIQNSRYNSSTFLNDIALLKVASPFQQNCKFSL